MLTHLVPQTRALGCTRARLVRASFFFSHARTTAVSAALLLAQRALQFYLLSDVCVKDLAYEEMYVPLKELVRLLEHTTTGQNATLF